MTQILDLWFSLTNVKHNHLSTLKPIIRCLDSHSGDTLEGVGFSRDQILTRIGNLLSRKQMLEASRNATHTTKLIEQIDAEISSLQLTLEHSAAKLASLARQVGEESQSSDSHWLAFQFDSKASSFDGVAIQQFASTAANYGANAALWSVKSSLAAGANGSDAHLRRAMNRARVKVKGELLRVTVNRPWFRPSLFENMDLMFRVSSSWIRLL